VLGEHVQQKGSLVNAQRTRFDFTHGAPLTADEIARIEALVNAEILQNSDTQAREMELEAAKATGAMMLFGEKYGETVRVLNIGTSAELCGGTHVQRTGDIGLFKIVGESGVASGVRRIEALTGSHALAYLQTLEHTVEQAAQALKTPPAELLGRIAQVQTQVKDLEKEIAALKVQEGTVDRTSISQVNAYNTKRQQLLNRIDALDKSREAINAQTDTYNANITAYNDLIVRTNSLSKSLDSTLQATPSL